MPATAEETSIYALIGTTTPEPQGRSGSYEVMSTFDSLEEANESWKGIAQRTLNRYPSDWVTHGFRLVEVPPEKRETFEQMHETYQRARRDPEVEFTDEEERVNAHKVHQRYRAFRGRWQQHLQSLIDNHEVE
jgi:hypothetical protein